MRKTDRGTRSIDEAYPRIKSWSMLIAEAFVFAVHIESFVFAVRIET